jgi:hypothetical protein
VETKAYAGIAAELAFVVQVLLPIAHSVFWLGVLGAAWSCLSALRRYLETLTHIKERQLQDD